MRHPILLTLSFFFIAFFTLLQLNMDFRMSSPTGAAQAELSDKDTHYAYTLDHLISGYLGTITTQFPRGACGETVQQLYDSVAHVPLEVTSGFQTSGQDKVVTLNFGMERNIGSLDIVTGTELNQNNPEDTLLSLRVHSTVRMPPGVARLTHLQMNLYGNNNGLFTVERGSFSTPALECSFTIDDERQAECSCDAHEPDSSTDEAWTEA